MRKFSINKDQKAIEPSDVQIKRHQDFSRLYHDYELVTKRSGKPIYKNPKLYLLLVLLGIIFLLIFLDELGVL